MGLAEQFKNIADLVNAADLYKDIIDGARVAAENGNYDFTMETPNLDNDVLKRLKKEGFRGTYKDGIILLAW